MDEFASYSIKQPDGEPTTRCFRVEVKLSEHCTKPPDVKGLSEILIERYAAFVDEDDLLEWMAELYSGASYMSISALLPPHAVTHKPHMYSLAVCQQMDGEFGQESGETAACLPVSTCVFYLEVQEQMAMEELLAALHDAVARQLVLQPEDNKKRGLNAIVLQSIQEVDAS